jgi:transcriptional regulator with XRE-family HTH domain
MESARFRWDGPALRRLREARGGLHHRHVAAAMGLTRERVSQLERSHADALRQVDVWRYLTALAQLDVSSAEARMAAEPTARDIELARGSTNEAVDVADGLVVA